MSSKPPVFFDFDIRIHKRAPGDYEVTAETRAEGRAGPEPLQWHPPPELQVKLGWLQNQEEYRLTQADFRQIGSQLFEALFHGQVLRLFTGLWDQQVQKRPDTYLRLRLDVDERAPEIAALPWELLYWGGVHLGTQTRTLITRQLLDLDFGPIQPLTLDALPLALVVIPDVSNLDTDAERQRIKKTLTLARLPFEVLDGVVTVSRLADTLASRSYQVVHFIGHGDFVEDEDEEGTWQGRLRFNSPSGGEEWVAQERLQALFGAYAATTRLVVLNACRGGVIGERRAMQPGRGFVGLVPALLKAGVAAVVAMQHEVHDDMAIQFAESFYKRLSRGQWAGHVDLAVALARNDCFVTNPSDWAFAALVLYLRAADGLLFDLPHSEAAEEAVLLEEVLRMLHLPDVHIGDGVISAGEQRLTLTPPQAEALEKYLATTPAATADEREARYLARLCLHPDFHRWQRQYVVLSGSYQRQTPEITPAFTRLIVRGEGAQRQIERVPLPDIRQALAEHRAFVLLAQPGGGKTTVLQRLALDVALQRLQGAAQPLTWLPLFVRLASQEPQETPLAFLERMWRLAMPGSSAGAFTEALQQGDLCILCDALNESLRERYWERVRSWKDFAHDLPAGNRLVITCRRQDYQSELAVQQIEIDPLSPGQIEDFACKYLTPERGQSFWQTLQDKHGDLVELASIPYYLLMMLDEYAAKKRLPASRGELFHGFVQRLLQRERDEKRHEDWIDADAQMTALASLAFAMQEQGVGTEMPLSQALSAMPGEVTLPAGKVVVTPPSTVLHLAQGANLLAEVETDGSVAVKFMHHLLQEYFAALKLLLKWDGGEDLSLLWRVPWLKEEMPAAERGEWDPLPSPPTTRWEESTIVAASLAPALVDAVRPANPALAARCLLEGCEPEGESLAASRQDMLARLDDPNAHLRSRIEAGLLLGRLGDPRFPVETFDGVKVILPPLVEIPSGRAVIGSGWWNLRANTDERPRHTVTLAHYALGRFPVTNAEFKCFMDAGGYDEERFWSEGGKYWRKGEPVPGEEDPAEWWLQTWKRWKANPAEIEERLRSSLLTAMEARDWREYITWSEEDWLRGVRRLYPEGQRFSEPRFWQDQDFNNPSQPVVGVCWYEAAAYANWLKEVTGQPLRLPSEPEWEWAARRGRRAFPWSGSWDPERLNSLEGRVLRTTPVGAYPQGMTPDGLHDLAGNVWEWTGTRYAPYPYDPDAKLEDLDAVGLRVVRGGGWAANRRMVRCAFRLRDSPWNWSHDLGFRVARSLSA